MKYCTKCGGVISDFAIECGHCGQRVGATSSSINDEPWKNEPVENDMSFGFGYEEPVTMGSNPERTGTYNYSSTANHSNSEASKRANKIAAIIGVVFLCVVAVSVFFIIRSVKSLGHKEEKAAVEKWLNAMIDGDIEEFVGGAYCPELLETYLKYGEMEKEEFYDIIGTTLKASVISSIQYKNLRVKKVKEIQDEDMDDINATIQVYTGIANVITNVYEVEIEYQTKTTYTGWGRTKETIKMYRSNGKLYILPEL